MSWGSGALYESAWEWRLNRFTDEIELKITIPKTLLEADRDVLVDGLGNDAYFACISALKEEQ